MLTLSTQYRLAHAIKVLAIAEANIEARRKLLSDLTLFEPSTAFKRLDQQRIGELTMSDISEFLLDNNITFTQSELTYLFKKLDNDHNGRINFSDFQKSVLPRTDTLSKSRSQARAPYHIEIGMLLPTEVEFALSAVFLTEIQGYRESSVSKSQLVGALDYNSLEAFKTLDLFNLGYISLETLNTFQRSHGLTLTNDEALTFFKAVDQDEDGRISYSELVEAVHLMEPLPYIPSIDINLRQSELQRIHEQSRSLERLYLSQYPYYYYPYYPRQYPTYFPSNSTLPVTRLRESSLERLRRSQLQQIQVESTVKALQNEQKRSVERQRSIERLRILERESILRQSQITEQSRLRELDRLRDEELRRSRERVRLIENENLKQEVLRNEAYRQANQIENQLIQEQLQRSNHLRELNEEAILIENQARQRSLERLNSIERLNRLEELRRLENQNYLNRLKYNSYKVGYPYSIMDSINQFGYRSRVPLSTDSPKKSDLKQSIDAKSAQSKIIYENNSTEQKQKESDDQETK